MSDSIRSAQQRWAVAIALLGCGPIATLQAQSGPFDTAGAPSEQKLYHAESPQVVGVAAPDGLSVGLQLYEAGKAATVKLLRFRRTGESYASVWERQFPLPRLAGVTSDGANLYVLSAALEDLRSESSILGYRPNVLALTKLDDQGKLVWERDVNSAEYLGDADGGVASTAIFSPLTAGTGALAHGNGKIVVTLATNTLPDANINQRHQRAQYFVVGEDGAGFKAATETSWRHSFDQRLLFDGQDFVFMDLGDAGWYMPGAGIALRKIKPTANGADFIGDLQGVYVYVRQAETAGSQNFSFTSLGDLQNGDRGYVALFSSETNNPGAQRNGWNEPVNEPRNLGMLHVTKGFDTVAEGEWNSPEKRLGNTIIQNNRPTQINVTSNVVDSEGPTNTFSRADKPDLTFTQTGVNWLTHLPAGVSAERPKLVRIAADRYIALWEEWSYSGTTLSYRATKSLLIDEQGRVVRAEAPIAARLNPSGADRAFELNGSAAWITTTSQPAKLTLHTVDANLALTSSELGASDAPTDPAPTQPTDTLSAGGKLEAGAKIQSGDGRFTLTYQTDGNLVIYGPGMQALWASNTSGSPVGHAIMQDDGNFVIYGPDNNFVWNSGTVSPGSRLVMQSDGNLVIYSADGLAIWASNTVQP